MIAAARVLGGAAAGAALLIAGASVEPAGAQGDDACRADFVVASGRGKFRPFTKTKELEGRGSAMADAVVSWEREVANTLGQKWKLWAEAKDKTFECAPTKRGKIIGSSFIGCTIKGRPCAIAVPVGGAVVASNDRDDDDDDNDRADRNDDRDDNDRADRDDDRDVRYGRYRGRSWYYRYEMRRQERLAKWRSRREQRGMEREESYQRYLKRERDRTERWARERAEARERYFARWRD